MTFGNTKTSLVHQGVIVMYGSARRSIALKRIPVTLQDVLDADIQRIRKVVQGYCFAAIQLRFAVQNVAQRGLGDIAAGAQFSAGQVSGVHQVIQKHHIISPFLVSWV